MASVSKIKAHPTKPKDTPVFAVVSYALEDAPDACGFSDKMLRDAITAGALIAHRATNKPNSKLVVRSVDLDAWVQSLPFAGDYRNQTA